MRVVRAEERTAVGTMMALGTLRQSAVAVANIFRRRRVHGAFRGARSVLRVLLNWGSSDMTWPLFGTGSGLRTSVQWLVLRAARLRYVCYVLLSHTRPLAADVPFAASLVKGFSSWSWAHGFQAGRDIGVPYRTVASFCYQARPRRTLHLASLCNFVVGRA